MKPRKVVLLAKRSALSRIRTSPPHPAEARRVEADPEVREAHTQGAEALARVQEVLAARRVETRLRTNSWATPEDVRWADAVVSVGGDGTFLMATHAVEDGVRTPLLGVNSAPGSSHGYFCAAAEAGAFEEALGRLGEARPLWRMRVRVNGAPLPVLATNDVLFASLSAGGTARYELGGEAQKSSGVWVATAAGSSAALRSAGGEALGPLDKALQFRVRELFAVDGRVCHEARGGHLPPDLSIRSKMLGAGLFFDGRHDAIPVRFGDVVTFEHSESPLWWVAPAAANK